jgi:predicted NBD/HSP70 family sugar kinase
MSIKQRNSSYKRVILKQLYFSQGPSCAELSLQINKSIPLTTKILEELMEDGLVQEKGYGLSSGGRRPQVYSFIPDTMYIVSVAMDQLVTRIALIDMQNKYVTEVEKFELLLANNLQALEILTERIKKFIDGSGIERSKIVGIGIGMPGFVNAAEGLNYTFFNKDGGESIVKHINRNLGLPVHIDNDSSLIALAELKFGGAKDKQNVMVVNVGWGIGLGLILNGKLFRGNDGFAGEFSHIPIFTNNKLCACGKTGCLETETSLTIIVDKAIKGIQSGRVTILTGDMLTEGHPENSFEAIVTAAKKGDRLCVELFSEAGYNIGRGVAILIHILNPEMIILSGRGSLAGKILEAPIWQALNEHCIPRFGANTKVQISSLGYDAELIGAAALVMENFEEGANENLFQKRKNVA